MARIVEITRYESEDGTLFNTLEEANSHDTLMKNKEHIASVVEAYADANKLVDRVRARVVKEASAFLAFYLTYNDSSCPEVPSTEEMYVEEDE